MWVRLTKKLARKLARQEQGYIYTYYYFSDRNNENNVGEKISQDTMKKWVRTSRRIVVLLTLKATSSKGWNRKKACSKENNKATTKQNNENHGSTNK